MPYRVIVQFKDLEDKLCLYKVGDTYPRTGVTATAERIESLLTGKNAGNKILIEEVPEVPEPPTPTEQQPEITQETENVEYPKHLGGAYYQLSNGVKIKGKEEAVTQELNLTKKLM